MKRKIRCIGASILSLAMVCSLIPATQTDAAASAGNYSFIQDYTLGWTGGISVYQDGASTPIANTDVPVYDAEDANPFAPEVEQAWDEPNLRLTQPIQFTTSDGVVHDVESMLTNFDFIADPTAIDNSDIDGKLYVYGTTEGIDYSGGVMAQNGYNNHSLTILSTSDMVNWTDEGTCDTQNLTNEPSYNTDAMVKNQWATKAWAPSGLKIDGDGDGDMEYYLFHTNSGAVGYVRGDSPTGPWYDDLKKTLFAGISGVKWCFDPAVLVDDKGNAYCYFGGGVWDGANEISSHPNGIAHPKTGRVCKLAFEEGTGKVLLDGEPQEMDTYYMFEDSEINQFNGKYYYSYCANFNGSQTLTKAGSIPVYVSSDPIDIVFAPDERDNPYEAFTENDVYHHFLGTVLENPSTIYGESYNNHHHMQSFKGRNYIFYHSTVLNNTLYRVNKQYRCLHVDEIDVNAETDEITIEPSYEGAEQIENFNPYKDFSGNEKYINATTTSYSAGVKSTRDDDMVTDTKNGSPMVLDEIDTGDWTKIQGVDFGKGGAVKVLAEVKSNTNEGAIEVFVDDPTKSGNMVASIPVSVNDVYTELSTDIAAPVKGVHDVYFVFRGSDYTVASWKFTEGEAPAEAPTSVPTPTDNPGAKQPEQPKTEVPKTVKSGVVEYAVDAAAQTVKVSSVDKKAKSVVIPATVDVAGKQYAVTEIPAKAFANSKKLKAVTIGKNVKSIGAKAFYKCPALKKITVKSTVLKKVGKAALKGINSKATIKVPKKKLKAYKKIFKGKGQSKKVKIK